MPNDSPRDLCLKVLKLAEAISKGTGNHNDKLWQQINHHLACDEPEKAEELLQAENKRLDVKIKNPNA